MNRRTIWPAILLAGMLAAAAAAAPDDGVRLAYKFDKGAKWTVDTTSSLSMMVSLMGGVSTGSVTSSITETYTVEAAGDGQFTVTRTGKEMTNSQGLANVPPMSERELLTTTFTQSATGKIVKVGLPAFQGDANDPNDLSKWISYSMDQTPPLLRLPDQAVEVGDEWEGEVKFRSPDGKETTVSSKYRLVSYDAAGKKAYIYQVTRVPLDFDRNAGGLGIKVLGDVTSRSLYTFDVAAGRVIQSTSTTSLDFTTDIDAMGNQIRLITFGMGTVNGTVN